MPMLKEKKPEAASETITRFSINLTDSNISF